MGGEGNEGGQGFGKVFEVLGETPAGGMEAGPRYRRAEIWQRSRDWLILAKLGAPIFPMTTAYRLTRRGTDTT